MKKREEINPHAWLRLQRKRISRIYYRISLPGPFPSKRFPLSFFSQARTLHIATQKPKRVLTTTRMNPLSWTVDDWYFWSQWASAFFVAIAIISGRTSNARQSREIAAANERTAQVYRKLGPRYVTKDEKIAFATATQGLDKSIPVFVAREDPVDRGARAYAIDIFEALSLAGFKTELIDPTVWPMRPMLPLAGPMKAFDGVVMQFDSHDFALRPKLWKIRDAFSSIGVEIGGPVTAMHPKLTPAGGAVIVVGAKPDPDFSPSK